MGQEEPFGMRSSVIEKGRVGKWRGGGRPGMSVSAPFVWRCLSGSTIAPFPLPSHRYPGASDISSPPCLPRLLPAGAVAGWALHPLEKRRLVTAHVEDRSLGNPAPRESASESKPSAQSAPTFCLPVVRIVDNGTTSF